MRGLVMVEEGVRDVRKTLSEFRQTASRLPGYETVAALHRDASQLVARILSTDRQSLTALADAELARRSAVAGLERGESTLAAYRRVLAPPVASAALVDRRG
jgi:phage shock protein A